MNKDISILFAFMMILLVAILFDGDGALPAMADAAQLAREQSQTQDPSAVPTTASTETQNASQTASSGLKTLTPPPPPHSEPDPPFIQPEPLK